MHCLAFIQLKSRHDDKYILRNSGAIIIMTSDDSKVENDKGNELFNYLNSQLH